MSLDLAALPVKQIKRAKWLVPEDDNPQSKSAGTALPPRHRHTVGSAFGAPGNGENMAASAATVPGTPAPAFRVDTRPDHLRTLHWPTLAFEQAQAAFAKGRFIALNEGFELGMNNEFRTVLQEFLRQSPEWALPIVAYYLPMQPRTVQAESLIYIGEFNQPETVQQRVDLAVRCLNSDFPEVRDAAGIALADLNSLAARPFLQAAVERESNRIIRRNLEQALHQLKRHA